MDCKTSREFTALFNDKIANGERINQLWLEYDVTKDKRKKDSLLELINDAQQNLLKEMKKFVSSASAMIPPPVVMSSGLRGCYSAPTPQKTLVKALDRIDPGKRFGGKLETHVNHTVANSFEQVAELVEYSASVTMRELKQLLLIDPELILEGDELTAYGIKFDSHQLKTLGDYEYRAIFSDVNVGNKYVVADSASQPFARHEYLDEYDYEDQIECCNALRPMGLLFHIDTFLERYFTDHQFESEDYEIISRCVWRAGNMANNQYHLTNIVFLGVTNTNLWVVSFRRWWEGNRLVQRMTIVRSDPQHLTELWALLTKEAVTNRNLIFVDPKYSFHLTSLLNKWVGMHGFCRVVTIGSSCSTVFAVSFPKVRGGEDKYRGHPYISRTEKDVAIKVTLDKRAFEQEVKCLQEYSAHHKHSLEFYAVGFADSNSSHIEIFTDEWRHHLNLSTQRCRKFLASESWKKDSAELMPWWEYVPAPCEGGVIIMRCGNYNLSRDDYREYFEGLRCGIHASLEKFHDARILHCDLRWENIMYFHEMSLQAVGNKISLEGGWQLVDLSLSEIVPSNDQHSSQAVSKSNAKKRVHEDSTSEVPPPKVLSVNRRIHKGYGQYIHAGLSVLNAGKRVQGDWFDYKWTTTDDLQMLVRTFQSLEEGRSV